MGDGWSSSEGGSELELDSDRRGTKWNFFRRFGTLAGDCGMIGDWAISPAGSRPSGDDTSCTGKRGTNWNLVPKFELGFKSAGECGSRRKGGCLGENAPPMDEVLFDPALGGGLDGGVGDSDNKGSKPTGTRFNS